MAHLYAAEGLVLLDKISEAIDYLNPDNIKDISFDMPTDGDKSDELNIKTNPPPSKFKTLMNIFIKRHPVQGVGQVRS